MILQRAKMQVKVSRNKIVITREEKALPARFQSSNSNRIQSHVDTIVSHHVSPYHVARKRIVKQTRAAYLQR